MLNLLKLEVKTAPSCGANELRHFPHHGYIIQRYQMHRTITSEQLGFQFSTRHTTPFLCVKYTFVLAQLSPVPTLYKVRSSKPPQLQVGVFKARHIRYIGRGILSLLRCFYSLILLYRLRRYSCAKLMHISSLIRTIIACDCMGECCT